MARETRGFQGAAHRGGATPHPCDRLAASTAAESAAHGRGILSESQRTHLRAREGMPGDDFHLLRRGQRVVRNCRPKARNNPRSTAGHYCFHTPCLWSGEKDALDNSLVSRSGRECCPLS